MDDLPRAAGPALIPLMTLNETLTRRRDPHRRVSCLIYFDDVHVGSVARAVGTPGAAERQPNANVAADPHIRLCYGLT